MLSDNEIEQKIRNKIKENQFEELLLKDIKNIIFIIREINLKISNCSVDELIDLNIDIFIDRYKNIKKLQDNVNKLEFYLKTNELKNDFNGNLFFKGGIVGAD